MHRLILIHNFQFNEFWVNGCQTNLANRLDVISTIGCKFNGEFLVMFELEIGWIKVRLDEFYSFEETFCI